MSSYQIYCNGCDIECCVSTFEGIRNVPSFCGFCGSELDESNVREDEDFQVDEWNKLSEDSLNDLEDWKE